MRVLMADRQCRGGHASNETLISSAPSKGAGAAGLGRNHEADVSLVPAVMNPLCVKICDTAQACAGSPSFANFLGRQKPCALSSVACLMAGRIVTGRYEAHLSLVIRPKPAAPAPLMARKRSAFFFDALAPRTAVG